MSEQQASSDIDALRGDLARLSGYAPNTDHRPVPRTANGRQYWVTCPCGWESEDLPADYLTWMEVAGQHLAEAEGAT